MLYCRMKRKLEPSEIKESLDELKSLRKQVSNHRLKTRIQVLILLKESQFKYRQDLASHLGIAISSVKNWINIYMEHGIDELLKIRNGGKRYSHVDSELHEALKEKANNSEDPFMSYVEAVQWVKENYDQTIKYTTLRSYLVDNFKTKVKRPRKSHYKKDEQAIEAFKKTSQPV